MLYSHYYYLVLELCHHLEEKLIFTQAVAPHSLSLTTTNLSVSTNLPDLDISYK